MAPRVHVHVHVHVHVALQCVRALISRVQRSTIERACAVRHRNAACFFAWMGGRAQRNRHARQPLLGIQAARSLWSGEGLWEQRCDLYFLCSHPLERWVAAWAGASAS